MQSSKNTVAKEISPPRELEEVKPAAFEASRKHIDVRTIFERRKQRESLKVNPQIRKGVRGSQDFISTKLAASSPNQAIARQ